MSIKVSDLERLGFTRKFVTIEEAGFDSPFVYRSYDVISGPIALLTEAVDVDPIITDPNESEDSFTHYDYVELLETDVKFRDIDPLRTFIQLIEDNVEIPESD